MYGVSFLCYQLCMRLPGFAQQALLPFGNGWGGARKRAGRPRAEGRGRVPHRKREEHRAYWPVLVTLRTISRDLRSRFVFPTVRGAIASSNGEPSIQSKGRRAEFGQDLFRVCEYSVQGDHVHLLVEASSSRALQRGVRGLSIRLAKRVNQLLFQKGPLIADRYHARLLKTPRSVRNALVYVFGNFRKHGHARSGERIDQLSSAPYFGSFSDLPKSKQDARASPQAGAHAGGPPVEKPRTWLLAHGWRRHGLISVWEQPHQRGQPRAARRSG